MKKIAITLAALALSLPGLAGAMDHSAMGHGTAAETKGAPAEKPALKGVEIRSADVQGYRLTYRLIDMKDEMKGMPMQGHDMSKMKSHHLMVYLAAPGGKTVTEAKLGYMVVGPDKAEQKTMAMFMEGGFGADVDLKVKGAYKVTAKAVIGEKTLIDEFAYTVK